MNIYSDIIKQLSNIYPKPGIDETLSGKDKEIFELVMNIICQYNGLQNAYLCTKIGLKNDLLLKFYKECCDSDILLFNMTFLLLKEGVFDSENFKKNLSQEQFIPFINKNLTIDNINYNNFILAEKEKKEKYINLIVEDFNYRLNKKKKKLL